MNKLGAFIEGVSRKNKEEKDIPVYSVSNKGFCTEYFSKNVASLDTSSYKIVRQGEFAYNPSRINVGSVDYLRNASEALVSPLYIVFTVSEDIDKDYLLLYLKSPIVLDKINRRAKGGVRNNLKLESLKDFEINFPSLEKQKMIARIFDTIEEMIKSRKKLISLYSDLRRTSFVRLFGDNLDSNRFTILELGDVFEVTSSKRICKEEMVASGIPFFRVSDLVNKIKGDDFTAELFVSEKQYEELKAKHQTPNAGDILITSRGTLGLCYVYKNNDSFYFQDGMTTWLRNPKIKVSPQFIADQFSTSMLKNQIDGVAFGTTVPYLSLSKIRKLRVIVPPYEIQERYCGISSKIEQTIETIRNQIRKLELLRANLQKGM